MERHRRPAGDILARESHRARAEAVDVAAVDAGAGVHAAQHLDELIEAVGEVAGGVDGREVDAAGHAVKFGDGLAVRCDFGLVPFLGGVALAALDVAESTRRPWLGCQFLPAPCAFRPALTVFSTAAVTVTLASSFEYACA